MRIPRFLLLLLLAFAPATVCGQDTLNVVVNDVVYGACGASFGVPLDPHAPPVGPLPLVVTEPALACDPITNADEIAGNIALIGRGDCAFVLKAQHAIAAGAEAVVIYNNEEFDPDRIVGMGGDCPPHVCTAPAVAVSYNSGQALLPEVQAGAEAVLDVVVPIDMCWIPPLSRAVLSTGIVETVVLDTGFFGGSHLDVGDVFGFTFNGEQGLYVSSVLVGRNHVVSTNPHHCGSEFIPITEVEVIPPPFLAPFEDFSEGVTTRFATRTGTMIGVEVRMDAYARDGDPFVVFDLTLENPYDTEIDSVYAGLFANWDVGDFVTNLGAFSEETQLLYVYDAQDSGSSYFGMAALGVAHPSGWTLAAEDYPRDFELWENLTTPGTPLPNPQDVRAVLGVGPFDLAPGGTANARFALVAGASEAEIIANAAEAQSAVAVSAEATDPVRPFALSPAFPNPFSSTTALTLDLQTAQAVRVVVFDVLGREVAVLHDGLLSVGKHLLVLDAARLPSGIYLAQATGNGLAATQRFTLAR